jgi:hypothetical protein
MPDSERARRAGTAAECARDEVAAQQRTHETGYRYELKELFGAVGKAGLEQPGCHDAPDEPDREPDVVRENGPAKFRQAMRLPWVAQNSGSSGFPSLIQCLPWFVHFASAPRVQKAVLRGHFQDSNWQTAVMNGLAWLDVRKQSDLIVIGTKMVLAHAAASSSRYSRYSEALTRCLRGRVIRR